MSSSGDQCETNDECFLLRDVDALLLSSSLLVDVDVDDDNESSDAMLRSSSSSCFRSTIRIDFYTNNNFDFWFGLCVFFLVDFNTSSSGSGVVFQKNMIVNFESN